MYGRHPTLSWTTDVSAASWIADRLHPFAKDVSSVVPTGFEAYARIFHPIERPEGRIRWSELARRNARIAHPEMQFHMIARPAGQPGPRGYERGEGPRWGSLPVEERRVLVEALRPATKAPDRCCFLVWEGFAGVDDQGVEARVEHPHRRYLIARAPIDAALWPLPWTIDVPIELARRDSPNLWWPEDRAWIVATGIDLAWTYLGGSAALIEVVLADPRLEVLRAQPSDHFTYDSDRVNAGLNGAR